MERRNSLNYQVTVEKENMDNKKEPKYEFVLVEGEVIESPIKRKIAKTMEVTEHFTVFDAMSYLGKLKKAIADKESEIKGLKEMEKAYMDELEVIENVLGVQKMEEDFQKNIAENIDSTDSKLSPYNNVVEK